MREGYPQPAGRAFSVLFVTAVIALFAAHCGNGHSPTAPSSAAATPQGAPVIQSVTLDRQSIDAGQEVTATVQVADPSDSTSTLRYEWSVTPSSGILSGDGTVVSWHSPMTDRVPGSYTMTVTVIKSYIGTDASGQPANLEYRVSATSAPVIVNDALREMRAMSEMFLTNFMDANVAPEMCVRDFLDSCAGKQQALQDLATARAGYSQVAVNYDFQTFVRSAGPGDCTAADGSAACAMSIYNVQWTRRRTSDGQQDLLTGIEYFNGVYAQNRWWLCGSRFESK